MAPLKSIYAYTELRNALPINLITDLIIMISDYACIFTSKPIRKRMDTNKHVFYLNLLRNGIIDETVTPKRLLHFVNHAECGSILWSGTATKNGSYVESIISLVSQSRGYKVLVSVPSDNWLVHKLKEEQHDLLYYCLDTNNVQYRITDELYRELRDDMITYFHYHELPKEAYAGIIVCQAHTGNTIMYVTTYPLNVSGAIWYHTVTAHDNHLFCYSNGRIRRYCKDVNGSKFFSRIRWRNSRNKLVFPPLTDFES